MERLMLSDGVKARDPKATSIKVKVKAKVF